MGGPARRATQLLYRVPSVVAIIGLIGALSAGANPWATPMALFAVVLAPALLPRAVLYPPPADPPPELGEGGGGGPEPDPPTPPPGPRDGGLPLPDADPAPVRRRDHDRPRLTPRRPRRPAREPDPAPQRERRVGSEQG